jgi:hypothetical protein
LLLLVLFSTRSGETRFSTHTASQPTQSLLWLPLFVFRHHPERSEGPCILPLFLSLRVLSPKLITTLDQTNNP